MVTGPGSEPADRPTEGPPPISFGGVVLDPAQRRLRLPSGGPEVSLTRLQAALLAHLMSRAGQPCSRRELMCDALGYPVAVGSRTVDVHVATLRAKLEGALTIRSVRGVGYSLEPIDE
jgi:DNA-binding response OmpR family regulator